MYPVENFKPQYGFSESAFSGFYMNDIDTNGDWIEVMYAYENLCTKPRKHKLYHNTKGSYFCKHGRRYYTDEFYRLS